MNCSWLSCFPYEDERLFIRGRYKLELQSIRIRNELNEWMDYGKFNHAFYAFHCMLSGQYAKVKKIDISIMKRAIDYKLKGTENKMDVYVKDNFNLFTQKTEHIVLNLYMMHEFTDEEFVDLVMNSVRPAIKIRKKINNCTVMDQEKKYDLKLVDENDNLMREELLSLFCNLKEIIIIASSFHNIYVFDIFKLLDMVCLSSDVNEVIIKDCARQWVKRWWKGFGEQVLNDYNLKGIKFEQKQGRDGDEDWLTISIRYRNTVIHDTL